MSPERRTFYITTPIYYVNDRPHIGHSYTTTVCDVAARFHRFLGLDVFFLTGTDEHGIKVEKSAGERGVSPQALADENAAEFQRVLRMLNFTNDDFIRTTQRRHTLQVERFVQRLIAGGDIYLGEYEGWYDEGQEEFVPDTRAKDQEYKSVVSGKPLVRMREENYFFRLSAYQKRLDLLYENQPGFVRPEARRNEMLGRLRDGLADVPVTRTSFSWGIPVPGRGRHVLWVWLDALSNYITALGLGLESGEADLVPRDRSRFWPADYHVIGKEILFFHAIFWPAMLMALDLPLPRCIYAHSFWISEGRKMSKSLGNFIDLPTIQDYIDSFSLDAFRWFLITQGPLGSTDTDFARAKFIDVYNSDLANTLGNSISRVVNMIGKYFEGRAPEPGTHTVAGFDWPAQTNAAVQATIEAMSRLELGEAMGSALGLVRQIDAFIDATRPFTMAKDEAKRAELAAVLYQCAETLRIASVLLWCAMPDKIEQAWRMLGQNINPASGNLRDLCRWGGLEPGTQVVKGEALFPRFVDSPDGGRT